MKAFETRLASLLASAEVMAGGAFDHRIDISPDHDELDALAFAINVIASELSFGAGELARAKEEAERRSAELAAAQETLLAKSRLATLGQLAGGVAHQIRNPLAVILNATAVLERSLPAERHPDATAALNMIREEVRHANTIVRALLDYARVKQPARQLVSLVDVLDRVLESARVPSCVDVERHVDDDVPAVHVDADQMHDALLNLVLNAVEAMPDGGELSLTLSRRDGLVVVGVRDTGPGIPRELEPHLFEPLRSSKPSGIGLGLVTARTFVEAHDGKIVLVPTQGGACFEVQLPG